MKHRDRGYQYQRTEHDRLEKAFADLWEARNGNRVGIDFGHGILQDLFMGKNGWTHIVTDQERYVAATVVQWLGTNCGFAFLQEALAKVGHRITGREPHRDYSLNEDPMCRAIEQAALNLQYDSELAAAERDARQATFDEAEPH